MTEQDQYLIDEFKTRIRLLIGKQNSLKSENGQLLEQLRNLQDELAKIRKENELLVKKYDNLKLAKVFMASDDEKQDAKQRITKIVREIDKCIAQLNV
ncbi:hypothetical protein [Sunxiuqinia dokdonensis]|uniref:Phenylalanyl-tRNA synthetase subunit beta n=1 Tax=Sunxiuqinia dokdonensis TaxID=1409788 RepID=A0A0L8VET4_9BACT|nr:hypothetical protein [Sunxiuqinia dokdonensis]KOH46979.1 hypothetical protein NC99_02180 [Sunxiuqinia dokdonensis]